MGGHRVGLPRRSVEPPRNSIAAWHKRYSHTQASKEEWTRDLAAKVKAKADDLVRKREVRAQVRSENQISERELVEATAEAIANVRMEHRGDIKRARELANLLFSELSAECTDVEALHKLGELMLSPDEKGQDKLNDLYHKIISMPQRVKSMKDLSDTLKTLIGLEREAYSIKEDEPSSVNKGTSLNDFYNTNS